jgi:four helix bundle suffix protein
MSENPSASEPGRKPAQGIQDGATPTGEKRLRPSGGYRRLRSFQAVTIIYDATVRFCERFMDKRSRTVDQMVQAARSGRQNIAEGSRAAATSSQMELKLVNVARASLDELLLDFEDYLRQHGHRQWLKDDPEALAVRAVGKSLSQASQREEFDPVRHWQAYAGWLEHREPAVVANALLCLIHQTNYLLDQQITALERQFISDGGYTEQLAAMRRAERARQQGSDPAGPPQPPADAPHCPKCSQTMVLRTARQGPNAGSQFWGCSRYPDCRGTRQIRAKSDRTNSTDSSDASNQANRR